MTAAALWCGSGPLVLASGSATRRLLLEAAGIPVLVRPAALDERNLEAPLLAAGAEPAAIALALARAKAMATGRAHPAALVLGCDQTLALDGRLFHKPASRAEAGSQLAALSGRTHALVSAAVLTRDGAVLFETAATARMRMRDLSGTFIDAYLASAGDAARASVGGYQIEGLGLHLFDRIEGDHATILGLPLLPVLGALRRLGCLLA